MRAPLSSLRLILGDQLSPGVSCLRGADKKRDTIMLCEVMEEATYVRHHPKKIAFLFAAMRHFAEELRGDGYRVRYVKLDDAENTGSFDTEVARALSELGPAELVLTEPGEYRVLQKFLDWRQRLGVKVEIRSDDRFLCSIEEFRGWAKGKKQLRMEYFYREMRKRLGLLMEKDGGPAGGEWNYDKENRKPLKAGIHFPERIHHKPTATVRDVLQMVGERFSSHFGTLEPFRFAVTREQALRELNHFIEKILPDFGDHQDAMAAGEPYLYHSLLSCYLNAGLLLPLEVCQKAENAWREKRAPLNAVEGFIRQILGWREYIRGMYWLNMPKYAEMNHLQASRPLPSFYWTAETDMACLGEAIRQTRDNAYSHHIQRLMITGNFALLAGINPQEVCDWYLAVYADAYEWVELPNTLGMALYADGGIIGSKPYAASGKYIRRMSNFCDGCRFDPELTIGENACPFNSLYWDFLERNQKILRGNRRMAPIYAGWNRMSGEKRKQILERAKQLLLQKL